MLLTLHGWVVQTIRLQLCETQKDTYPGFQTDMTDLRSIFGAYPRNFILMFTGTSKKTRFIQNEQHLVQMNVLCLLYCLKDPKLVNNLKAV